MLPQSNFPSFTLGRPVPGLLGGGGVEKGEVGLEAAHHADAHPHDRPDECAHSEVAVGRQAVAKVPDVVGPLLDQPDTVPHQRLARLGQFRRRRGHAGRQVERRAVPKVADGKRAGLNAPLDGPGLARPEVAGMGRFLAALGQVAGVEDDEAAPGAVCIHKRAVEPGQVKVFFVPVVVSALVVATMNGHLLEVDPSGQHQQKWQQGAKNPAAHCALSG